MSIFANPFLALGGTVDPTTMTPEEEEELSWWERFGRWRGEQDLYDKQMGINRPNYGEIFAQRQAPQSGGADSLNQFAALARLSNPRQPKPRMNPAEMIRGGHLRTLLGG